eukprot:scaffold9559_cov101-Isochrysis_galbana.AAC.12
MVSSKTSETVRADRRRPSPRLPPLSSAIPRLASRLSSSSSSGAGGLTRASKPAEGQAAGDVWLGE